jgi:Holliday junction resolvase RusA-like endonuclease
MEGEWCRTKPDLDNYIKAVCDALWGNDSAIAKIIAEKIWCEGSGSTTIKIRLE